ncbi:MAG: RluA family pseudouridine synthase [Spirochaetaceae bacterium]|jgi:23S rRNA pseudouridine955/2504/2580 synthase|nr:RluA family pseudouridine synthase [Spirochaetaceae bacterium]
MKRIEIVYEDEDCLVINKEAGLPVQGGHGAAVNLDALLAASREPRPLLVHRLDRDTSGLVLTAKSPAAAAFFSKAFAGKTVRKRYLAVCRRGKDAGTDETGVIAISLEQNGVLKDAVTHFRRLATADGFALLQLELGTGRMHQIRRHLAQKNLPVIGDRKYGDFTLNKTLRREAGIKQMLLHAARLTLTLRNGRTLDLSAPLPPYFTSALLALGLGD